MDNAQRWLNEWTKRVRAEREKERDLKQRLGRVPRYGSVGGSGPGQGLGDEEDTGSSRNLHRGEKGSGSGSGQQMPPKSAGGNERTGRGNERTVGGGRDRKSANNESTTAGTDTGSKQSLAIKIVHINTSHDVRCE